MQRHTPEPRMERSDTTGTEAAEPAAGTTDDAMVVCLDWFGPDPNHDAPVSP